MISNQLLVTFKKHWRVAGATPATSVLLCLFMVPLTVLAAPTVYDKQAKEVTKEVNVAAKPGKAAYHVKASNMASGFSVSPSEPLPVIEYSRYISMLENQDVQPMLRVYGDGRVKVHIPAYMKKSGDYEYTLTQAQLVALLRKLSTNGMMDFDSSQVRAEKKSHDQAMKQKGELFYVSDSLESVVDIRLKNYQRTSKSAVQTNFSKRFKWTNLEQDARHYKTNRSVQDAAAGIKELDKLINHPAMKKVK